MRGGFAVFTVLLLGTTQGFTFSKTTAFSPSRTITTTTTTTSPLKATPIVFRHGHYSQQPLSMASANSMDLSSVPDKRNKWSDSVVSSGKLLTRAVLTLGVMFVSRAAHASGTTEHLHTGQKIANFFRSFGLPDVAVLAIIAAMPVVELRGAIPVGVWMGLPITTVLLASVLGNMVPIVPLLFLLRNERLKALMAPVLERAEKKSKSLGVGSLKKQWVSLAAFVGIPLPGTGAWTGAMASFILGMPTALAISSIFTGVVSAGAIMTAITLAGKKGGLAALAVLLVVSATELLKSKTTEEKQDFLEATPYWDQSTVPTNTYKNKSPFVGKVISTKRIVGPKATGETCHIIIDHKGEFPYWEGQSWGVVAPGTRAKDGKPHAVRLYSIASSRYGDKFDGQTGSLCVRRATYWDPEMQAEDPAKKGICSNFLCDTKTGDDVKMTGPVGKAMLLPEQDPATNYIMVATGTGIAPYRGFIRRLFVDKTPAAEAYKGQAWLFLGVANSDALLYDDEFQDVKEKYPDNFRLDYALSREQANKKGGKMYIQDKVEEYADEIFQKLNDGAHIYFCGLKGMMPGIEDMLKGVAASKGLDYATWIKGLKSKKQWHVEVY